MNASENDSAYLSFEKHEATTSPYHFDKKVHYKVSECSCAWARRNQRSNWFRLDFFGSFCIKAKRTERLFKLIFTYFLLLVQKFNDCSRALASPADGALGRAKLFQIRNDSWNEFKEINLHLGHRMD